MMKKTAFGTILVVALVLLAGTAMANRDGYGMMRGYGMMNDDTDNGYGFCDRYPGADPEDVRAITGKYADQFDALEKQLVQKRDEIRKAKSNDGTTVGQMNKLRDEMLTIKRDYRGLRGKVADELSAKFGNAEDEDYAGMMEPGMMGGRHHRGMMGDYGYYGGCRR
jgi:hypothetical protein